MSKKTNLSIVIPVHNEEENVIWLHEALKNIIPTLNLTYEIILIDDGSTDKTFEKLKSINSNDLSNLRGNATKTVSLLESTPFVLYTEDLANKKSVSSTISLEDLQLGDEITINLDASGSVVRVAVVRYVK